MKKIIALLIVAATVVHFAYAGTESARAALVNHHAALQAI